GPPAQHRPPDRRGRRLRLAGTAAAVALEARLQGARRRRRAAAARADVPARVARRSAAAGRWIGARRRLPAAERARARARQAAPLRRAPSPGPWEGSMRLKTLPGDFRVRESLDFVEDRHGP